MICVRGAARYGAEARKMLLEQRRGTPDVAAAFMMLFRFSMLMFAAALFCRCRLMFAIYACTPCFTIDV